MTGTGLFFSIFYQHLLGTISLDRAKINLLPAAFLRVRGRELVLANLAIRVETWNNVRSLFGFGVGLQIGN